VTQPPVSVPPSPILLEVEVTPPTVVLELTPPVVSGQVTEAAVGVETDTGATGLQVANEQVVIDAGPLTVIFASVPVPGQKGATGPGGSGAVVIGALLSPMPDGVITIFTVPDVYIANSTGVFLNGLREIRNVHYNELPPTQVQFTEAPLSTDVLSIDYTVT
jgi:hypothetical protein